MRSNLKSNNFLNENFKKILTNEEILLLKSYGGLNFNIAETMRENVLSTFQIPLGIIDDLNLNGKKYFVPLAIEEKGVITQIEKGLDLINHGSGINAESSPSIMIGQIQVIDVPDSTLAENNILKEKQNLLLDANSVSTTRKALDLKVRNLETIMGNMMIVELFIDVKDSMGANIVDSMCELISPTIEQLSGGKVNIRILSNLATKRMVTLNTKIPIDIFSDKTIPEKIINASIFAETDPYRAATHNKGIMNGISAVLLATGNDTRAVEAGAHSYASLKGTYNSLSTWRFDNTGNLVGFLELPMSVGTVGGMVQVHPLAKICLKILDVKTSKDLGQIAGAIGLASNLGALYTLVTDGITSVLK
ncbi:hydroxymethylglutaryl-CoA reductase, degradative [Candidatus Bathyarchaeota archaeon]|nr:hydroxymethylglutaryl-CoA reductase, degradative [Candidatus Bathyarchaeota archaeon]